MNNWQVTLADRQSDIYLAPKMHHNFQQYLPRQIKRYFILTDENVASLYLESLKKQLTTAGIKLVTFVVPAGEASKSLCQAQKIYQALLNADFNRQDALIAFGGGVVGDLGAFVASTYMRGLTLIQLPTTVIAQADSSLGGKTALDFADTKNMIGTFCPARCILVDPVYLQTLAPRQLSAGLAEVIKMLLIAHDATPSQMLLRQCVQQQLDLDLLTALVTAGLRIKSSLIQRDFYDLRERRYLNFGHTVGHAVEACAQGRLLHGEAVSIGMMAIMRALVAHERLDPTLLDLTLSLAKRFELPIDIPAEFSTSDLMARIQHDKKATDTGIEVVLLQGLGQPYLQKMSFSDLQDFLGWS